MNEHGDKNADRHGTELSSRVNPGRLNNVEDPMRRRRPQVPAVNWSYASVLTLAPVQVLHHAFVDMAKAKKGQKWGDADGAWYPHYARPIAGGMVTVFIDTTDQNGEVRAVLPALWRTARSISWRTLVVAQAMLAQLATLTNAVDQPVVISIDRLLEYRGLKGITRSSDARPWHHGYRVEQRLEIAREMALLSSVNFYISNVSAYPRKSGRRPPPTIPVHISRFIVLTDVWGYVGLPSTEESYVTHFRYAPGAWVKEFTDEGTGLGLRQLGKMLEHNLSYDPYREHWELAMSAWLTLEVFPNNAGKGKAIHRRVQVILDAIGQDVDSRRPRQVKERFERMMNRMVKDGYLEKWSYLTNLSDLPARKWAASWAASSVELKPSPTFDEYYTNRKNRQPNRGKKK